MFVYVPKWAIVAQSSISMQTTINIVMPIINLFAIMYWKNLWNLNNLGIFYYVLLELGTYSCTLCLLIKFFKFKSSATILSIQGTRERERLSSFHFLALLLSFVSPICILCFTIFNSGASSRADKFLALFVIFRTINFIMEGEERSLYPNFVKFWY